MLICFFVYFPMLGSTAGIILFFSHVIGHTAKLVGFPYLLIVFQFLRGGAPFKLMNQLIWVVSFTLVTLLRHMCSPGKLFDVDAPWIVRRSTFLLVAFQNWHFYLKNEENNNLQILFIYVMSANEMKKPPTTSTSKSLTGEEYVRQQFMLYL